MSVVRILYRGAFLVLLISAGGLLTLLFQRGTMQRNGFSSRITRWWHRTVIRILGIRLKVYGTPSDSATLFAANHLSWLDIHVIGSQLPARFLSRAEIRHWPVFGWLASRAGTLYIPRGGKNAAADANVVMHDALQNDHHVVLFPESTTSDGNIRRFHGRLMQSAINAQCMVQPIAIRYPHTSKAVHDAVLYTGDMSFMQSAKNVMAARGIVAELHFLEAVDACDKTRDELARYAETRVKSLYESDIARS
jgi:1-acyl-sn-glycerol-3-phosphate acyltransferase